MRISEKIFVGQLAKKTFLSPLGPLSLLASSSGIRAILWEKDLHEPRIQSRLAAIPIASPQHAHLAPLEHELQEYFAGLRRSFTLPLEPIGSPFQKRAWQCLGTMAYGKTYSYAWQAVAMGCPQAWRAIGNANAANPLSILIPCHRVIRKNGELGGFAGGATIKRQLLEWEISAKNQLVCHRIPVDTQLSSPA